MLVWPAALAAAGAVLVCWGLALGGYWPFAVALHGPRALATAGATVVVVLRAGCGSASRGTGP
jgi:hypothetical protein